MSEIKTAIRPPIRLKKELLAPPHLTGWTPFPTSILQFIACIHRFLFIAIFESELNIEYSLSWRNESLLSLQKHHCQSKFGTHVQWRQEHLSFLFRKFPSIFALCPSL
jgi:hypothetical protein